MESLPPIPDGHARGYLGCTEPTCRLAYYYDFDVAKPLPSTLVGRCHGDLIPITRAEFEARCAERQLVSSASAQSGGVPGSNADPQCVDLDDARRDSAERRQ